MEMIRLQKSELLAEYQKYKDSGKKLDMSRGKPSAEQLDNMTSLLTEISDIDGCFSENGIDCRNYGCLEGIPEAKRLFAAILGVRECNVIVCVNSSLNIMFDTVSNAYTFGLHGCEPWSRQGRIKFLCPVPGYDRHFAITKLFGIEMINIPVLCDGPDMDLVRKYAENDPAVKGIWCVPKYSNPTGVTYSDRVVREFAALKPAAKDFTVIWDDAYAVHDLNDTPDQLLPVLPLAEQNGTADHFYLYTSTSKISWSGAGISCVAMSENSKAEFLDIMKVKTIGFDKLAMLRHARLLCRSLGDVMKMHASVIRPKFELCYKYFERLAADIEGFTYSRPNGGYFINVNVPAGKAKAIVKLASDAGLKLMPAGATFPYGVDPADSNIRIAPTFPTLAELEDALVLFDICVRLTCAEG